MSVPAADETTLRCIDLVRSFSDGATTRNVIDGVSLDLHRGEITLLMGPSGSGKSTLLAIASGLLQPDSGQVLAREDARWINVWQLSPKEREQFRLRQSALPTTQYVVRLSASISAKDVQAVIAEWTGALEHDISKLARSRPGPGATGAIATAVATVPAAAATGGSPPAAGSAA